MRYKRPTLRKSVSYVLAVIALMVFVNYWTFRSTMAKQDFVRLVTIGQIKDAEKMVSMPGKLKTDASSHMFEAVDGTSCVVPVGKADFYVFEGNGKSPGGGFLNYMLGKQPFQLCAFIKNETGVSRFILLDCETHGSAIMIRHVGNGESLTTNAKG